MLAGAAAALFRIPLLGDLLPPERMEGTMMRAFRLCLVIGLVVFAASCSLKPSWDVVGKWQKMDGTETLEFSRNGTVTVTSGASSLTVPYVFMDAKHVQITLGPFGSLSTEAIVTADSLVLTATKGKVSKYKKLK